MQIQLICKILFFQNNYNCGQFPKEIAKEIMSYIALGMDWQHIYDIVHKNFKSSNELIEYNYSLIEDKAFYVIDFECSKRNIGLRFSRVPEIL